MPMHPIFYSSLKRKAAIFLLCIAFQSAQADEIRNDRIMTLSEKIGQLHKERPAIQESAPFHMIHAELIEKKKALQDEYNSALRIIADFQNSSTNTNRETTLKIALDPHLERIRELKQQIRIFEEQWKSSSLENRIMHDQKEDEFDGVWHQPDTTLGQLIIDYNASSTVYIVPLEIAGLKVHLSSQLAIPKASWTEMLELILSQMGVGIKQVIPFVKQLYLFRLNQSGLQAITDDRFLIDAFPDDSKVAFVLSPPPGELRRVTQFIDRFSPQEQLSVQTLGGQIVVVGLIREIRELLKIYDFITSPKRAQEYKIIPLQKSDSEEMAKILLSMFEGDTQKNSAEFSSFGIEKGISFMPIGSNNEPSSGFRVIPMRYPSSSIFLMGKAEQIEKSVQIIKDVEANIGDIQNKTIYWYACQHSEAEDLAKILSQVYIKLISSKSRIEDASKNSVEVGTSTKEKNDRSRSPQIALERAKAHPQDNLIVAPSMISAPTAGKLASATQGIQDSFIVDPKTNSIIMVVENSLLPKLKELVKKLDVPKRMVQIDLLMFEKRVSDSSSFGLNLLQMGSKASKKHSTSWSWNEGSNGSDSRGILQFALSRGKGGFLPAYELAYQFLLSQEDIQINANPSIITVNQTPARIAVVDQISINTGAVEYNREHVKDSYSRVEYGITIQITPTVHAKIDQDGDADDRKFVTLATEICFDTTHPNKTDRPEVTRRNIKNEVRVRDGETIILGGLKKKHSTGSQQSIPFLGDMPGFGRLFRTTALTDLSTEMFIFITPKIIPDNRESAEKIRYEQLMSRPGDIPEFLDIVQKAKSSEKERLFERSLKLLFSPTSSNF